MIEVFYILLLVLFGGLAVVTLTNCGINRNALKEELHNVREHLEQQRQRLVEISAEMEDLELDIELLEMEKASLEAQETCMRNLDSFSSGAPAEEEGA